MKIRKFFVESGLRLLQGRTASDLSLLFFCK
jgi:hypothetical protein